MMFHVEHSEARMRTRRVEVLRAIFWAITILVSLAISHAITGRWYGR